MGRSGTINSVSSGDQGDIYTYEALPGFNLINDAVSYFKDGINASGERGVTFNKSVAYLGFRAVSYLCIPLVLNAVSTLISGLLYLITTPTRSCNEELNDWCWSRLEGSYHFTVESLHDLTYDFHLVAAHCGSTNDSANQES